MGNKNFTQGKLVLLGKCIEDSLRLIFIENVLEPLETREKLEIQNKLQPNPSQNVTFLLNYLTL